MIHRSWQGLHNHSHTIARRARFLRFFAASKTPQKCIFPVKNASGKFFDQQLWGQKLFFNISIGGQSIQNCIRRNRKKIKNMQNKCILDKNLGLCEPWFVEINRKSSKNGGDTQKKTTFPSSSLSYFIFSNPNAVNCFSCFFLLKYVIVSHQFCALFK